MHGVVAEAQAVGDTGAQGDDVLQGRAQLRANGIGTGVHPEGVGHEGILNEFRLLLIGGGGKQAGGHVNGHFLSVAGAAEHHHVLAGFLGHHLAHAQIGVLL